MPEVAMPAPTEPAPAEPAPAEPAPAEPGWDPSRYLRYADERARPFLDLLARVPAESPRSVVDLGCGPGTLTALLKRRWPEADVVGIDSSPEMVAAADPGLGVRVLCGDLRDWAPTAPVDVLVSNAALPWVPDHLSLLGGLLCHVAPGGWLAFQVPLNQAEATHVCRLELEVAGSSARPALTALPPRLRAEFETELRARLRAAYPPGPSGTVLPFRRVFVVARRGAQR
jgi:trans-aconitate 2-methyltransferase